MRSVTQAINRWELEGYMHQDSCPKAFWYEWDPEAGPLPVNQLECCGKPGQSIGGGRRSYHQMRKTRGETMSRRPPSPSSSPSYSGLLRGKSDCLPLGSRSLHLESRSRKGFWGQPSMDRSSCQHWLGPLWCGRS